MMRWLFLVLVLLMSTAGAEAWFNDISETLGLDFVHFNGMDGHLYFAEMMGAGGALLDIDADGDLDLYLIQGNGFGAAASPGRCDQLYRNNLIPDGELSFSNMTTESGLCAAGYGMGIATGDVDNDGDVDLYLSNFGANELWLNDGQGHFKNATRDWNADDPRWSVAASFSDYDNDGWLDLYVANYTDFALDNQRKCFNDAAELEYCGPNAYKPVPDRLFHNEEGKRFLDVTTAMGIDKAYGAGLGVIAADFDGDRRGDFFVANDQGLNLLWMNTGERFRDDALLAGVAVNMEGKAEASMGVEAADVDGDGDTDLFMTHLARETNTLYINDGTALFEDRTLSFGLGGASLPYTGFGTLWRDFDNDGQLDLFVANGAVMRIDAQVAAGVGLPLREHNQLYVWRNGRYVDVSASNPAVSKPAAVSRGAMAGDIDNDGDIDIVVTNNNGPVQVLRNDVGDQRCWAGVSLRDAQNGRDVPGAMIRIENKKIWHRTHTDGSYVSAHDPRLILPLERCESVTATVLWPDGQRVGSLRLAPRRYISIMRREDSKPGS